MKSFLVLVFALAALPAHAERMKVATTFTIIADMARNVAGDAADVESITKPGAEIHNYQPTSGDLIRTSDADLVLANGLNLESWFQQFIDQMGDIPVAVVSDGVEPMSITGGDYDGKPNPHAWMALDNALIYVDNIAAAMAGADPDNAATFRANAEAYKARITDTIAPLRDAARALPQDPTRVFLAIGRQHLGAFAARPVHDYLLRLVDPPEGPLPLPRARVVVDRGPFTLDDDLALMRQAGIRIVVAKNAGGSGARAKIDAARLLGLPVVMVARPRLADRATVASVEQALDWLHHTPLGV